MDFYLIWKKTSFDGVNMTGYHCDMFHGCEVENNPRTVIYTYEDKLEEKIHLVVNLYNLGDIIKPCRHLVVSERVRNILAPVKNIAFLQVIFDKIINISYKAGIIPDENLFTNQPYSFTNMYKHDSSLIIGNYYELIAPEIYEIEQNYDDITEFEFQYRETDLSFKLKLSKTMLNENHIIWTSEGIIFRDFVFDTIEQYYNWDYFERKKYSINL